jgi:dihydrofolate reductase
MARVVVLNHVTLDGVMQAPGRADEDTRERFTHGGWSTERDDDVLGQAMGARMAESGGLLFGRRTYTDVLRYWNMTDSPFKDALNDAPKYVASETLGEPLRWPNSTLLKGDVGEAVARLKETEGKDLHVMGSGTLIQTLMRHDLIDEYVLLVHPVVLGSGRRLFPRGTPPTPLRLVTNTTTTTGVLITTYRPD